LAFLHRLSVKVTAGLAALLLLLAAASVFLTTWGFRQAESNATIRSIEGLEQQGRDSLLQLVRRQAEISDTQLARAENLAAAAADYMARMIGRDGSVSWDSSVLVEGPGGQLYDASPDRVTDVWIGNTMTYDAQTERDLVDSAMLDPLFPALMDRHPDIVARMV